MKLPLAQCSFLGLTILVFDVHIDANHNGLCDASDNQVVLLAFAAVNSTSGGVMAYGRLAFTGLLISI